MYRSVTVSEHTCQVLGTHYLAEFIMSGAISWNIVKLQSIGCLVKVLSGRNSVKMLLRAGHDRFWCKNSLLTFTPHCVVVCARCIALFYLVFS
jgi:hypothetical protein